MISLGYLYIRTVLQDDKLVVQTFTEKKDEIRPSQQGFIRTANAGNIGYSGAVTNQAIMVKATQALRSDQ